MTVDFKIWDIIFSPPAVAAIAAQFSSQAFKVFKPLVKGKPPDFTKIADYGGWPSAHTAFIVYLI
jgi:acid phosphatase family membrane protein YuiD